MKLVRIVTIVVLLFVIAPMAPAADFGIRAGRYNDQGENFVGAELVLDAGVINVNPNIEYSLAENVTAGSANLDVTLDVVRFARVTPYIGGGVGLSYEDDTARGSQTNILGNLIGGMRFQLDFLQPYAQLKYFRTLDNEGGAAADDLALTLGLRF